MYSQTCVKLPYIKHDIFLAIQTGGCLLLHDSSAESSCFLHYFHSAISNHLSIASSLSPEWIVAENRLKCIYEGHRINRGNFFIIRM